MYFFFLKGEIYIIKSENKIQKDGRKVYKSVKIKVYFFTRNTWAGDPVSGSKFLVCNLVEGI